MTEYIMTEADKQNVIVLSNMIKELDKLLENYRKMKPIEIELAMLDITETCVNIMNQYDHPIAFSIADDILKSMDHLRDVLDKKEKVT